jgi:uncharacterized SAM-binding protein YcdF (DUF218 family)
MKFFIRAAALVLFIALLRMVFITGLSNNTVYLFLLTTGFFIYGFFFERLKKVRWLNVLIVMAAVTYVGFSCFLGFYGMNDTVTYGEDAVIVLGCGIKGETVSQSLSYRLETALTYHQRNPRAIIFVSGGKGAGEDITEALAMERWLVEKGVPQSLIVREEDSYSTYENIQNTKGLMESAGLLDGSSRLALITSEFHIYRGEWFAKAAGLSVTHLHASSSWYSVPVNFARDCAAVVKMWVSGK